MQSPYFVAFLMQREMKAGYPNSLPAQKSPTFVRRKSDENLTDFLLKVRLCLCYTVYADGLQPFWGRGRKMARKWHRYADDMEKPPCYNDVVKKCKQFTCLKIFCPPHSLSNPVGQAKEQVI
jgi:hypothetical protein